MNQIIEATGTNADFAITETNSMIPANRAAWFNDSWAWAIANDLLGYFTFWYPEGSGSNIEWIADDANTIAALTAINTASNA